MQRPWLLILTVGVVVAAGLAAWHFLPRPGPDPTVTRIAELGGAVAFADDGPDRPVVAVNLTVSDVADADLGLLRKLPHLRRLYLTGTKITDAGLASVEGLTQLRQLVLIDTPISDAGLEHLRRLGSLEELDLSATRVTDAGLARLTGLTGLKSLYLAETPVTKRGIRKLKAALPDLEVYQSSF